jgi:hypothetical protein
MSVDQLRSRAEVQQTALNAAITEDSGKLGVTRPESSHPALGDSYNRVKAIASANEK